MTRLTIVFILTIISTTFCCSQNATDNGQLKMTFPSIYFKHNLTDYTTMPYTPDSCFKYIAFHFKDNINSLVIWRDSTESEELTNKRIKKLKLELNKYTSVKKIDIHSMGKEQKISRHTINRIDNKEQVQYLLSLNSVFDISKTRYPKEKKKTRHHLVWTGWKTGFHWSD